MNESNNGYPWHETRSYSNSSCLLSCGTWKRLMYPHWVNAGLATAPPVALLPRRSRLDIVRRLPSLPLSSLTFFRSLVTAPSPQKCSLYPLVVSRP